MNSLKILWSGLCKILIARFQFLTWLYTLASRKMLIFSATRWILWNFFSLTTRWSPTKSYSAHCVLYCGTQRHFSSYYQNEEMPLGHRPYNFSVKIIYNFYEKLVHFKLNKTHVSEHRCNHYTLKVEIWHVGRLKSELKQIISRSSEGSDK